MSANKTPDYETAIRTEIFAENRVITYQLLSRKLGINVELAKKYLYDFYKTVKEPIHVTYVVSGYEKVIIQGPVANSNSLENKFQVVSIKDSYRSTDGQPQERLQRVIFKVPQEKLEEEIKKLEKITGVHIYSIGQTKSNDITFLTNALQESKKIDCDQAMTLSEMHTKYGIIINPLINLDYVPFVHGTEKPKDTGSAYKYQPARRAETVQVKPEQRVVGVERKASTTSALSSRNSSTSSTTSKASKATKNASSLKTFLTSTKDSKKQHSDAKKQQPTLAQSFFGAKKAASSKHKTVSDHPTSKSTDSSTDQAAGSLEKEDHMDVDEPIPIRKSPPKESPVKKTDAQKTAQISEGLKNIFADVENQQHEETQGLSEEDEIMEESEREETPESQEYEENEDAVEIPDIPEPEPEEEASTSHALNNRKKRKVTKRTTKVDELGYLVVHMEDAWESYSESEDDPKPETTAPASSPKSKVHTRPAIIPALSKVKNKKKGKGGARQESLMSFFQK